MANNHQNNRNYKHPNPPNWHRYTIKVNTIVCNRAHLPWISPRKNHQEKRCLAEYTNHVGLIPLARHRSPDTRIDPPGPCSQRNNCHDNFYPNNLLEEARSHPILPSAGFAFHLWRPRHQQQNNAALAPVHQMGLSQDTILLQIHVQHILRTNHLRPIPHHIPGLKRLHQGELPPYK